MSDLPQPATRRPRRRACPVALTLAASAALWQAACTPAADRPPSRPSTPHVALEARFPSAHLPRGKDIYLRQCITCHQANGQGAGKAIPPLAGHAPKLAAGPQGRAYLARLGLYGLTGRIEVQGQTYYNLMPAQGLALADADVAGVLNYVLTQWGNDADVDDTQLVRTEDVARERAVRRSAADNLAFRRQAVPGVVTPP